MPFNIPTGGQIRAGRALCRIDQAELAQAAGLSVQTIKRLESFGGSVDATTRTVSALMRAFRTFDVVFNLNVGSGPGVRLLEPLTSPDGFSHDADGSNLVGRQS